MKYEKTYDQWGNKVMLELADEPDDLEVLQLSDLEEVSQDEKTMLGGVK